MKTNNHRPLPEALCPYAIGWDVGGAHLKAVQVNAAGHVIAVSQVYCPLWRGLAVLDQAVDQVLAEFSLAPLGIKHFVTMTAELADIFPDRHSGVVQITQLLQGKLSAEMLFYAGYQTWLPPSLVQASTANIASMNWLASVELLAKNKSPALFVDIGSTTTDLALISHGKPQLMGFNDAMRLQTDELIYTGVVRTPLMALAQKIAFAGAKINLAAEHFATTADVYTLTGDLPAAENQAETADAGDKSMTACARRIARMVGRDAEDAPLTVWQDLAQAFKDIQLQQIKQAIQRQRACLDEDQWGLSLMGAGVGDFLLPSLAQQLNLPYQSIADFIQPASPLINPSQMRLAAVCFPAYAVAVLGVAHAQT